MTDTFDKQTRSKVMSAIRAKDTSPEIAVRSELHKLGYRFRLHCKEMPGNPDIVLSRHKTVIFVHGCFWHGHEGCKYAVMPKDNANYWLPKLKKNKQRDLRAKHDLEELGWRVLTIWECEVKQGRDAIRTWLENALL